MRPSFHGRLVRLAEVQALAEAIVHPPHPDEDTEYVLPPYAASQVGVPPYTVRHWAAAGKVASRPSPHGRLVRLADVRQMAQARQPNGS
jgi:hypothetical protein